MTEQKQLWDLNNFAGVEIRMRKSDGFLNAKDMAKVKNKKVNDYFRLDQTKEFIKALEKKVDGISRLPIIDTITKGANEFRGTWIHPKLAIHFAMWISPEFSVEVTDWVERFMRGDITLVKDIVDRHDAINDTKSEVLIKTLSNQLDDYKSNIASLEESNKNLENTNKNLETVANELKDQIAKINEFKCQYCNRRYSNSAGLTRHYKNCNDMNMNKFKAIISFDRFLSYFELLEEYELDGVRAYLKNADTDKPLLYIHKNKKKYKYNIYLNESRWKVIKMLEDHIDFPLHLMLSENSLKMFQENEKNYKRIYKTLSNDFDNTLEEEFKVKLGLIVDDED